MISMMKLLIKTHKKAGAVVPRPVHASANSTFKGISRWLVIQLQPILDSLDHVVTSSQEVIRRLQGSRAWVSTRFSKLDVKDFFLAGEQKELVETISAAFHGELQVLVRDAVNFLLYRQYVQVGDTLHHAESGSGMGLIHSGHLSDVCFYLLAEKRFLSDMRSHGIFHWFRFRDDILVIHVSKIKFEAFFSTMQEKAKFYTLDLEALCEYECQFLDFNICAVDGRFMIWPYRKPSAVGPVLSYSSWHPPRVHHSWPVNQLSRMMTLSSSRLNAIKAMEMFMERFQKRFFLMQTLRKWLTRMMSGLFQELELKSVESLKKEEPFLIWEQILWLEFVKREVFHLKKLT